jgi:hypothetical protein
LFKLKKKNKNLWFTFKAHYISYAHTNQPSLWFILRTNTRQIEI